MPRFSRPALVVVMVTGFAVSGDVAAGQESRPQGAGRAPAAVPALPATPMGAVARGLLAVLDSGDDTAIRRFVDANASPELAERLTVAGYVSALRKLKEESGGLELLTPIPGGGDGVRMLLRSRAGEHYLGIEVAPDPRRPERFGLIGFHPMPSDPRKGSGLWEPEGEADASALVAHIQRSVARLVEKDEFSGVVLVARGDSVLLERAYGEADREKHVPNRLDTRFHVGSIDKMFTSVAIAQLVQAGRLSFDDTLARVLPEYPNRDAARRVTIRQILTHTAGLGDPFESPAYDPLHTPTGPQSAWFPLFAQEPLRFEPGARHEYSNGGYLVLGALLEKLTGRPYHEWVRDHVFRPAGMTDTEPVGGRIPNAAQGYYRRLMEDPLAIGARVPNSDFAGAPGVGVAMGGSYLTARDLFRFARALRGGRLLTAAMTDTVVTGKVAVAPGARARYGFGFYDVDPGSRVRGHSGGGEGSGIDADVEILWDSGYTIVVVGNYDTPAARAIAQGVVMLIARQPALAGGPK